MRGERDEAARWVARRSFADTRQSDWKTMTSNDQSFVQSTLCTQSADLPRGPKCTGRCPSLVGEGNSLSAKKQFIKEFPSEILPLGMKCPSLPLPCVLKWELCFTHCTMCFDVIALVLLGFNCRFIGSGWAAYRRRLVRRRLLCPLLFGREL